MKDKLNATELRETISLIQAVNVAEQVIIKNMFDEGQEKGEFDLEGKIDVPVSVIMEDAHFAKEGNPESLAILAGVLLDKEDTESHRDYAIRMLELARKSDNPVLAYDMLSHHFVDEYGLDNMSVSEIKALADSNDRTDAYYYLGCQYMEPSREDFEKNLDEAIVNLQFASNDGYHDATYQIAYIYSDEKFGRYDNESSKTYLFLAANQGNPHALITLIQAALLNGDDQVVDQCLEKVNSSRIQALKSDVASIMARHDTVALFKGAMEKMFADDQNEKSS